MSPLFQNLYLNMFLCQDDIGGNNVASGGTDGSCDGLDGGCSFFSMSPIPSLCRTLEK